MPATAPGASAAEPASPATSPAADAPAPTPSPSTPRPGSPAARAHATLLPYLLWLVGSGIALHIAIALAGNRIAWTAAIGTGLIGLVYAVYSRTAGRGLAHVRYGRLVAHALTYVAVVGGYLLHAYVLLVVRSPALLDPGFGIDPGWAGAVFAMGGFWMTGLLAHAAGALLDRGFEGRRA